MNINKTIKGTLAVASLTLTTMGASFAGNLAPGVTIVPPLSTETGVLLTQQTNTFTNPLNTYSGSLYSAVYQEAGGTLDFIFQVQNNKASVDNLSRIEGGIYSGYDVSAFYSTQAGGLGVGSQVPNSAFETNSTGVGFNFMSGLGSANLAPGTTSDVLIVRTNAKSYINSLEGVSDNTTVNVASYSPAAAVPEPASVIPFALGGLGLLGLIVRKTRRTSGAAA